MTLDNLVGKGLQREPTDAAEIRRFVGKIAIKLSDARASRVSADSRFDIANEALLQVALAGLRAHGLRPDSRGGHHVIALQSLELTIGFPRSKARVVDQFRRMRAQGLYDGSFDPSEAELAELLEIAEAAHRQLVSWLSSNRPELLGR